MDWPFQIGENYLRRTDIHDRFGGSQRDGIVTSAAWPVIFAFTGSGEAHGYADRRLDDGSYRYTGRGQIGPMDFSYGNKAIREHAASGDDILLFQKVSSGLVRYLGQFVCAEWEYEQQPDKLNNLRQAIVFHLVPIHALQTALEADALDGEAVTGAPLEELLTAAYAAGVPHRRSRPSRPMSTSEAGQYELTCSPARQGFVRPAKSRHPLRTARVRHSWRHTTFGA